MSEFAESAARPPSIMNKEEWHKDVAVQVMLAEHTGMNVSVIFADINGLKGVNDTYGHGPGDILIDDVQTVFAEVVNTLRIGATEKRLGDAVSFSRTNTDPETIDPELVQELLGMEDLPKIEAGRVGGDEIAIAAATDAEGAAIIVERLRRGFAEMIERPENAHLKKLGVGLAIGAASFEHKTDMTLSSLLAKADANMYEDKINQLPDLNRRQRLALRAAHMLLNRSGVRLRDVPKYASILGLENAKP